MNPSGSWCERPAPPTPPCELPSPFKAPDKPAAWCDVPKSPVVSVVSFLLRAAKR